MVVEVVLGGAPGPGMGTGVPHLGRRDLVIESEGLLAGREVLAVDCGPTLALEAPGLAFDGGAVLVNLL